MTKEEFMNLSDCERCDLVTEALVNLILFEELASSLCDRVFKLQNFEVMKIVLGAYRKGELEWKEK